ncbi:hypothetical protein [Methanooceanicella nereidis]|uniref:hypothetical protein n=1 Tax=Methanooceanicella nereidis TaxID=2052831 RepID=UPI001E513815|nr:hypothetical protein [Methanocella sp. CWC-04]
MGVVVEFADGIVLTEGIGVDPGSVVTEGPGVAEASGSLASTFVWIGIDTSCLGENNDKIPCTVAELIISDLVPGFAYTIAPETATNIKTTAMAAKNN